MTLMLLVFGLDGVLDEWTYKEFQHWFSPALWGAALLGLLGAQIMMFQRLARRLDSPVLLRRTNHIRDYGLLALLSLLLLAGVGELVFIWLYLRALATLRKELGRVRELQQADVGAPVDPPVNAPSEPTPGAPLENAPGEP